MTRSGSVLHVRRRRFHNVCNTAYTMISSMTSCTGQRLCSKEIRGNGKAKSHIDTVKDIATETTLYGLEHREVPNNTGRPLWWLTESNSHINCSRRRNSSGNRPSQAGLSAWYLSMYLTKRHTADLDSTGMTCRISAVQQTCSQLHQMKAV